MNWIHIVCLTLSWLSICLRFYVKVFLVKRITGDDWLLLLGVVLFSGQLGCLIRAGTFHDGHPSLSPEAWQMVMVASHVLNLMTTAFLKTSLAMTLMHFLASRWHRMTVITVTIVFNVYVTAQIFVNVFACVLPSQLTNNHSIQECVHWQGLKPMSYVFAVFNTTTDLTYILLPALVIWRSNLPRKVKISCSFVTLIGIATGTAGVVRVIYSGGFNYSHRPGGSDMKVVYASGFELTLGFIATSLACSTALLTFFTKEPTINASAGNTTKAPEEEETIDILKLSPTICHQKSPEVTFGEYDNTRDTLTLPTPRVGRANRFSWSRALTSLPVGTTPGHGSIVLLIEDPSDDETEEEPATENVAK